MQSAAKNQSATASTQALPAEVKAEGCAGVANVVSVQSSTETPQTLQASTALATTTVGAETNATEQNITVSTELSISPAHSLQAPDEDAFDSQAWQKLKDEFGKPLAAIARARQSGLGFAGDDDFTLAIKECNLRLLETKELLTSIEEEQKKQLSRQVILPTERHSVSGAVVENVAVEEQATASAADPEIENTTGPADVTELLKRQHILQHGYYEDSCHVLDTNVTRLSPVTFEIKQTLSFEVTVFAPEADQGAVGGAPLDVDQLPLTQENFTREYTWHYNKRSDRIDIQLLSAEDLSSLPEAVRTIPDELRQLLLKSNSQSDSKVKKWAKSALKSLQVSAEQAVRETLRFGHWAKKHLTPQSETNISLFPRKERTLVASAAATAQWSANSDTSTAEDSHLSQLSDSNSDAELSKVDIHFIKDGRVETKVTVPANQAAQQIKQLQFGVPIQELPAHPANAKTGEAVVTSPDGADATSNTLAGANSDAIAQDPADDADDEADQQDTSSSEKTQKAKAKTPKVKVTELWAKERYTGADVKLKLTSGSHFTAYKVTTKDTNEIEGKEAQLGVKNSITKKVPADNLIAIIYHLTADGKTETQPIEVVTKKTKLTKAGVSWVVHDE